MIISDLNFCEAVEFANEVFGGATAEADGYADAYAGGAVAYGTAVAEGDTTYADVKTSTIVREKKIR